MELNSFYYPPNIATAIKSRSFRWAGHVARMEEDRRTLKILLGKPTILLGKPTGKKPLGRW